MCIILPNFAVLVCGERGTGKTTLAVRWANVGAAARNAPTRGVDCVVTRDAVLWDTPGAPAIHVANIGYLRDTDAVVVTASCNAPATCRALRHVHRCVLVSARNALTVRAVLQAGVDAQHAHTEHAARSALLWARTDMAALAFAGGLIAAWHGTPLLVRVMLSAALEGARLTVPVKAGPTAEERRAVGALRQRAAATCAAQYPPRKPTSGPSAAAWTHAALLAACLHVLHAPLHPAALVALAVPCTLVRIATATQVAAHAAPAIASALLLAAVQVLARFPLHPHTRPLVTLSACANPGALALHTALDGRATHNNKLLLAFAVGVAARTLPTIVTSALLVSYAYDFEDVSLARPIHLLPVLVLLATP